jgi:hypothetical protein
MKPGGGPCGAPGGAAGGAAGSHGAAAGGAAAAMSGVPHAWQNWFPSGLTVPHRAQATGKLVACPGGSAESRPIGGRGQDAGSDQ